MTAKAYLSCLLVPLVLVQNASAPAPAKPAETWATVKLDLAKAIGAGIPSIAPGLKPVGFKTADGKDGWAIRIPGDRPIATPAYSGGMLFVGGGYGSHEFYAFDAATGKAVWKTTTSDDGPTAAVVEDGLVVFNTESCKIIVVAEKTGKLVWEEWLGDPLMSQPAIYKGRIYVAYPAGQRNSRIKAGYVMLSVDLHTGKHLWEQEIPGDVISAPVAADGKVYFTCLEGTSFAVDAFTGQILWKKFSAATSAPVLWQGNLLMSKKVMRGKQSLEGLTRVDSARGTEKDTQPLAACDAPYLDKNQGGGVALAPAKTAAYDASVGFPAPPPAAKLADANAHLGVSTVVGGWAYQGSRAATARGRMFNAQGSQINSVQVADGKTLWQGEVTGVDFPRGSQLFAPPSLGADSMYLAGASGHLVAIRQNDGQLQFAYALKHPILFQPALAKGAVYVGTADGWLICIKTGGQDADGWYAWGGNAQHNR